MLHAWEKYGEDAANAEFHAKYDRKQRGSDKPPAFRNVLRGKLDFIGCIRGRDDDTFFRLLERYLKLAPDSRVRAITATPSAPLEVLKHAIWLLESEDGEDQATAFALEGYGLVTAAHAVEKKMFAIRPRAGPERYPVTVVARASHHDIAQISIEGLITVQLAPGSSDNVQQGTDVTLLGYPNYHVGDDVLLQKGAVIQERVFSGVKHLIIEPQIVAGNSGGPVLDQQNRVIGIAFKGRRVRGKFSEDDELSSVVPIESVKFLKADF